MNNILTNANRIITAQVSGLKKEVDESQERLSRYTTIHHRITKTLQKFISEAPRGGIEVAFQSLRTVCSEIRIILETSLSAQDRDADASLMAKLTTLQQEKQAVIQIIRELRPGIGTQR